MKKKHSRKPNNVIISDIVIRELEDLAKSKARLGNVQKNAERALRTLDTVVSERQYYQSTADGKQVQAKTSADPAQASAPAENELQTADRPRYGSMNGFSKLDNKANLMVLEPAMEEFKKLGIPNYREKDILIWQAAEFSKAHPKDEIIYLTLDPVSRVQARRAGLVVQDFKYKNVADPNQIFPGYSVHNIKPLNQHFKEAIEQYSGFSVTLKECSKLITRVPKPNQIIEFLDEENNKVYYYIAKREDAKSVSFQPVTSEKKLMDYIDSYNNNRMEDFDISKMPFERVKRLLMGLVRVAEEEGVIDRKQRKKQNQQYNNLSPDTTPEQIEEIYDALCETVGYPDKNTISKALGEPGQRQNTQWTNIGLKLNKNITPVYEQIPYLELLFDKRIELMSVIGQAGTGKSLLALYAGLIQVLDKSKPYNTLMYTRPLVEAGHGLGFLPGNLEEKMEPWTKTPKDNLEFIFGARQHRDLTYIQRVEKKMKELEMTKVIQFVPIDYLAGRTLSNTFLVVDEAQLFDEDEMRLLVGRVGLGTKIVLLGDMKQISTSRGFNYDITESSSGLAHAIEKLADQKITGHIYLPENCVMRSDVAKLANLI
jgi:predicted ribonuclease YlaK